MHPAIMHRKTNSPIDRIRSVDGAVTFSSCALHVVLCARCRCSMDDELFPVG